MAYIEQDGKAAQVLREFQQIAGKRGTWEGHWQEIAQRVVPAYSGAFYSNGMARTPGEKRTEFIYDSTAAIALGRFASVVDSLLTPQNAKWHMLRADNEDLQKIRAVRVYFEQARNALFKYRYAPIANFASQNHENFRMLGAFGTGTMYIDIPTGDDRGLRYRGIHLGQMYFAENHQGIIDRAFRRYPVSARHIVQKWPKMANQEHVAAALSKTPDAEDFWIVHKVAPNADRDPSRPDYKGKKFYSCYVLERGKVTLEEGGYDTFPYAISRYWQAPGEAYGRSPAMDVLPSIKTLNEEKKTVLKQGQRTVDPVLLTHDDGVLDGFSFRAGALNPGAVTAEGRPLVLPLPTGNIAIGKDLMDDERMQINDAFYVTLFQILIETPEMTATEVMERVKEKGMLLTPTVGRQQSEYLGPMIERELDLLARQGLLPPMPPELVEAQGEYKVVYDGPLARAQRAEEAAGIMRSIETTLSIVNVTQDPEPLDHYNWDKIVPALAEIGGAPLDWMRSEEEIAERRDQRAQQQEQMMQIEAMPAVAGMAKVAQEAENGS